MSTLLRRVLNILGLGLLLELLALLGLLFYRRLERQPRHIRFPHAPLAPVTVGEHRLTIYNWGEDVYGSMLSDIRAATRRVLLETYIFRDDEVGNSFRKRLIRQAQHGIRVYLIFDGLGSLGLAERYKRWPRNVHTFEFGPLRSAKTMLKQRLFLRTHRKILVVDEHTAYLGGINIGKEYRRRWRDTHLKIEGPLAQNVAEAFERFWNAYHNEDDSAGPLRPSHADPQITICVNDPIHQTFPISDEYIKAFDRAEHTIRIASAYFLPTPAVYAAILGAATRGVQIEIMVPEKGDVVFADWGARGLYEELLAHNITVWVYGQTVNHSKTCTIDGRWSTIGSANLDHLSLHGNFEINAFIEDEQFAQAMEQMWAIDLQNCRQITAQEWSQRSWLERGLEVAVLPLYRWM